jgi:hypothetical protein
MEQGKISRKHAKGAHGQVMQVVENVYEEAHGELPEAFKKQIEKKKGKGEEMDADHAEDPTGRYDTARSTENGYVDRMKTGKAPGGGNGSDRMKTAKSSEQDRDRMHTAENGEQDRDRMHTAKADEFDQDGDRWAGQEDGYDQVSNMDQYDAGMGDYPEGNKPKMSTGTDPYGRDETETKIPTETEEMPDNEVFAVQTQNVMSDKNMRVLRQTSSQGRQAAKGGAIPAFAEPEPAEETSELGVTAHGEGAGKPSKEKQLTPGAMDSIDDPAEVVGPSGAYAESYKGEKKSTDKHLTPGAFDDIDEADQTVGPSGAYAEGAQGKKSNAKQLTPGAMDTVTNPAEISKKSGGVYAEEHGEKKDPYTKTGFGSTYEEGEGDDGVEEGEESYGEGYSVDHCGMNYGSPMRSLSSMDQGMDMSAMYEELMSLKQKYAELENRNRQEKMNFRRMQMAEAIGHMYTEGRLTDGIMPEQELVSYVEGLEFGTLEFSEGETAATKLLTLLSKLPPMVSFGEVAGGTFQYSEQDLDPHAAALKMVEESNGKLDYVEALKRTMFS